MTLLGIEGPILLWFQSIRTDWLTAILTPITHLADHGIFWIALCVVLLIFKRTRKAGVVGFVAMAIGFIVCNLILKNAVARVRPYYVVEGLEALVPYLDDWSFPSGHACASFAVALGVHLTQRKKWTVVLIVLAVLIALSRLYVGVHFPTDVLAGAIIGTLGALISHKLVGQNLLEREGLKRFLRI